MTAELRMFTICQDPSDYPGKFVVRGFTVTIAGAVADAEPYCVADTLEEARLGLHPQYDQLFARLAREPEDDGVIVETWL